MDNAKIKETLRKHRLWLNNEKRGQRADLFGAELGYADLRDADLRYAKLRNANLMKASLRHADLRYADLGWAKLWCADLRDADLKNANLRHVNLTNADLRWADLSGAKGLLSPIGYLQKKFQSNKEGIIVYKSFREHYPNRWRIKKGNVVEETCNPSRTAKCACGINFGTILWARRYCSKQIWKCLIKWEWLPGVVVPYNTTGKCRCERLQIVEKA